MDKTDFSVFDVENSLVYLDSAASTLRPRSVSETMHTFMSFHQANIHRGAYKLSYEATRLYEDVRNKVANFIHAKHPEEIIFTYGATDAVNLLLRSLNKNMFIGSQKGSIIVSIFEHHSNLVPWQQLAHEQSIELDYLYDFSEESLEKISSTTKIVAITLMSNATGYMPPIQKIIQRAHEQGAIVVCDGAQYVGHEAIDVVALDIDFLVFSGHKMFGPTGIGVLYGKKKLLEQLNPYRFGGDMIEYVTEQTTTYAPLPNRLEAGTPNIEGVIGLGAAIDYIQSIGIKSIAQYVNGLRAYCYERLKTMDTISVLEFDEVGRPVTTQRLGVNISLTHGPVISFNLQDVHPHDVSSILDTSAIAIRAGHHCAQPLMHYLNVQATCRVSFQVYNTREDIDFFIQQLSDVRRWLGYGA